MLIDIGFYDGINLTVITESETIFGGSSNLYQAANHTIALDEEWRKPFNIHDMIHIRQSIVPQQPKRKTEDMVRAERAAHLREQTSGDFEVKRAIALSQFSQPRLHLPIKSFTVLRRDLQIL